MRMIILALAALPIGAAAAGPVPKAVAPEPARATAAESQRPIRFVELDPEKQCPKPLVHRDGPDKSPQVKKLTELPPADAYHAVLRLDDNGCLDPVMVGYQYRQGR